MNPRRLLAPLVAVLAVGAIATPSRAAPVLLDRVVATVDSLHIYRSDVLRRARPHLAQIRQAAPADQRKVVAEMHRELVARMVDEALIANECQRLRLSVEPTEIDLALDHIAGQNKLDRQAMLAEIVKQGLSEKEYRAELRRQILEARWEALKVRPKIPPGTAEADWKKALATARTAELTRLRQIAVVEVRW